MDVPERIGPYAVQRLLGEGGSAYVYQAYDPRLERRVALKVLKLPSPEWVVRLKHEAMLQARLHHPGIAQIYDVGEAEGRTYLALQFIPGTTLGEAAPSLGLEARVRILAQAADAVHAAHRQGLIHRDLKPSNLLLARDEAGQPWPYVVDFGLARLWEGQSLTAPGQVLGSPSYMAPEQAQGREVDPRTDVYGLGATLFELLTGRAPFEGKDVISVLMKVVQEEAPSPAQFNPGVPADLAAVVLRCLEKDPARRYPSAAHLRDDLHRFLDGEPILAKAVTPLERVRRWVARNRALAAVSAAAFLGLGVLGGALAHARWTAARKARIAEELGRIVSDADGILQRAYLLPEHDVAREKARVRARLAQVEALRRDGGALARGPADLALGRGHLALGDFARARDHLERARAAGAAGAELDASLGVACANLYIAGMRAADPKDLPKLEALERSSRDPALRYLKALGGQSAPFPPAYIEGLLAVCEARFEDAVARSREAVAQAPDFLEAICLEGDAEYGRALRFFWDGRYDACREGLARAEAAYGRALAIGRSFPLAAQKLGTCHQIAFNCAWLSGGEVLQPGTRALETLERAARMDSTAAAPHAIQALVAARLAEREARQGGDAWPWLSRAQEAARRALALEPAHPGALESAATLSMIRGDLLQRRGEDPRPAFEEGERWGLKLMEVDPSNWGMRKNLGLAQARIGDWLSRRGLDSEVAYRKGAEHCRKAVEQSASGLTCWNLGAVLGAWALARREAGQDARDLCLEAVALYRRGLALSPSILPMKVDMAEVLVLQGRLEAAAGRDPEPAWKEAEALLDEAQRHDPPARGAELMSARLGLARAEWAASRGQGPRYAALAQSAARRALAANPKDPEAWIIQAGISALEPGPGGLSQALRHLARAEALSPGDPLPRFEAVRLRVERGGAREGARTLLEAFLGTHPGHRPARVLLEKLGPPRA